jgi:hypothetical protein
VGYIATVKSKHKRIKGRSKASTTSIRGSSTQAISRGRGKARSGAIAGRTAAGKAGVDTKVKVGVSEAFDRFYSVIDP